MSTLKMREDTKSEQNHCKLEIESYINSCVDGGSEVSFAGFVRDRPTVVIQKSVPGTNYKAFWANIFGNVVSDLDVELVKERVDWTAVDAQIHGAGLSTNHPSDNSSTTPSSKASASARLSTAEKATVENIYYNLPYEKWTLSTGKIVEDTMHAFVKKCSYEHPSHSLILDPMDPCWSEYFTKEEIQEIRMHNAPQLQELPEGLQAYLRVFANKHVLEDLVELHLRHRFHPSKVDERWAEKAIGEVLDLYYYSYNFFNKTENDLLRRLWIFIEKCFDESVFEVVSGEKASTASSERKNDERSLPGTTAIPRKTVDAKVDILVRHLEHEYAAGEAGVSGGVTCTKFVVESNLKLPKTLKDIIWSLSKRSPGKIRSIRVPGFVINGTELAIKIMDLPRGNVCRLYSFAAMEFPLTAETFYKGFVPLLTLVWQCKSLLKATLKSVQEDDDMFIPTIEMLSRQPTIPACMTSPRSKKRKAVEKDE